MAGALGDGPRFLLGDSSAVAIAHARAASEETLDPDGRPDDLPIRRR
ncbi:MAG: hypothetical protein R2746_14305 [Acidimicrobiales bacterium]